MREQEIIMKPLLKTSADTQPPVLTKRIGSTTYRVGVHFSQTSRDTLEDKIKRLVRRESEGKAAVL